MVRIPASALQTLLGEQADLDEKLQLIHSLRAGSGAHSLALDRALLRAYAAASNGLKEARQAQAQLSETLEKLTEPPWHVATYLGMVETGFGPRVEVIWAGSRHVVRVDDALEFDDLRCGDEVYLCDQRNMVMSISRSLPAGETATYDRATADGRLVLRARDEEIIVVPADRLDVAQLCKGDLVRWSRSTSVAYEIIEGASGDAYFLEETPEETFEQIGGLRFQTEQLRQAIRLRFDHSDAAELYRLNAARSILLVGGPGLGKTLMARALANWLATLSATGRSRFMYIKPGSLNSVWYGQSEQNYRDAFRTAREAGEKEPDVPVVMFFDEVDSVAATRGATLDRVGDRVLTALAAELDGLTARGNILIVAATNRADAIDPALMRPGRLGDRVIRIPQPDRAAALEILGKHLATELPYDGDREELLEACVSHIYAPNGTGDLATIRFADGERRGVTARDLTSGAVLRNIADHARERACLRAVENDGVGITLGDLVDSAAGVFAEAAGLLTRYNCHAYLTDLPEGLTVASVQRTESRVRRPHRFVATS
jgi:proteasome-associated ATPase